MFFFKLGFDFIITWLPTGSLNYLKLSYRLVSSLIFRKSGNRKNCLQADNFLDLSSVRYYELLAGRYFDKTVYRQAHIWEELPAGL